MTDEDELRQLLDDYLEPPADPNPAMAERKLKPITAFDYDETYWRSR